MLCGVEERGDEWRLLRCCPQLPERMESVLSAGSARIPLGPSQEKKKQRNRKVDHRPPPEKCGSLGPPGVTKCGAYVLVYVHVYVLVYVLVYVISQVTK